MRQNNVKIMPLKPKLFAAGLLVAFAGIPANAELFGGVDAGTYGETSFEEIDAIELRSYAAIVRHPYEVLIKDTPFQSMIVCQLYDKDGTVIDQKMDTSGNGETRFYFTNKTSNASARCFYVNVERLTRPSSR